MLREHILRCGISFVRKLLVFRTSTRQPSKDPKDPDAQVLLRRSAAICISVLLCYARQSPMPYFAPIVRIRLELPRGIATHARPLRQRH